MKKIFVVATVVILLDQVSKYLANLFGLEVAYNQGISLGMFNEISPKLTLLAVLLLFMAFLFFFKDFFKKINPIYSGLFVGGALSNLIDRFVFLSVRDWLPLPFLEVKNNLADWAIFVGLFLIIFRSNYIEKNNGK
jgi:lipoprotein signal peptidase